MVMVVATISRRLFGYPTQQLPLLHRGGEVQAAHPERRRHSLRLETAVQSDAGTGRGGQAKGVRDVESDHYHPVYSAPVYGDAITSAPERPCLHKQTVSVCLADIQPPPSSLRLPRPCTCVRACLSLSFHACVIVTLYAQLRNRRTAWICPGRRQVRQ